MQPLQQIGLDVGEASRSGDASHIQVLIIDGHRRRSAAEKDICCPGRESVSASISRSAGMCRVSASEVVASRFPGVCLSGIACENMPTLKFSRRIVIKIQPIGANRITSIITPGASAGTTGDGCLQQAAGHPNEHHWPEAWYRRQRKNGRNLGWICEPKDIPPERYPCSILRVQ